MLIALQVQRPSSPEEDTLGFAIRARLESADVSELSVSVAYVTCAGIRHIEKAFGGQFPVRSRWLFGLDDYITQPGAIDLALAIPRAEVKVVSHRSVGARFHPKLMIFEVLQNSVGGFAVIGSSNLTGKALEGNAEANVLLGLDTPEMAAIVAPVWKQLWEQGHTPTKLELDQYRLKYDELHPRGPQNGGSARPDVYSDETEMDPSTAEVCWIECGYVTGGGTEIEIKGEQAIFFNLDPSGGAAVTIPFQLASGIQVSLRMTHRGNQMWRLKVTRDIPEAVDTLRPLLTNGSRGRSPYVAVFRRSERQGLYDLNFITLDGAEFQKLVTQSQRLGTYGRTSARQYGWC